MGSWTLVEDDWRLIGNKTGATRLGFALLLKFFELEARFPRHGGELPPAAVDYVAAQVGVEPALAGAYGWPAARSSTTGPRSATRWASDRRPAPTRRPSPAGWRPRWPRPSHRTCIYSQLKTCSSSEVAAMIEGVLRHCTDAEVDRNYVDTHGQSAVGFAFTHLLGFRLLPRLKNIGGSRLYPPDADTAVYPALAPVLTRPIRWELIAQQYDQMVKYATALRLGTAEAEAILRRFTRPGPQHPTYAALVELGRAVKTAFLSVTWNLSVGTTRASPPCMTTS